MNNFPLYSAKSTQLPNRSFITTETTLSRPHTLTQKQIDSRLSPRTTSEFNSDSYNRSLRRAFNRAKEIVFFNPDMTYFITLTYHQNITDISKVLYDIKQLIKTEKRKRGIVVSQGTCTNRKLKNDDKARKLKFSTSGLHQQPTVVNLDDRSISERKYLSEYKPKYLFVIEKQKRGALHVHMIANDFLTTHINEHGHPELTYWRHGFTNVKNIKDADKNFKPYLYLFKYMKKAQRLGKSFIYTSRGLDKIKIRDYADYINYISSQEVTLEERIEFKLNGKNHYTHKRYYKI